MCQSLKNAIIFGNLFYQIYLQTHLVSWISHEMVHQWWGNTLFFKREKNMLFMEEAITEYIKIQYIKTKKNGYNELLELYSQNISKIENKIPICDITNLYSQDAAWIIYNLAPYQLEKIAIEYPEYKINELLRDIFKTFEKQVINYETFINYINNKELRKTIENLLFQNNNH
jgi:hypothetical protein